MKNKVKTKIDILNELEALRNEYNHLKILHVLLYMTMITSMLVLIYKRINNVGYTTAVRRIALELNELIIKLIVKQYGGDPSLVFS
jgi:hypothetical protein